MASTTAATSTGAGSVMNSRTYPALPTLMAAAATMAVATTSRPTAVASRSERKASRT